MAAYQGGPLDLRTRYESLRSQLWSDRATFDAHWRDLAEFLMPRRSRFTATDRNKGDKRNQSIINSTGRFAARTLASGLHAGLTSPARPWMKLTTRDKTLGKQPAVKAWLHQVTERMLTIFATSNLYNVLPMVYGDIGIFGTGAMSMLQDTRDLYRCYSYPIGSYALGLDRRGLVSTFVRDYELTVRQVVEDFGVQKDGRTIKWDTISSAVKGAWDRGNYEEPVPITWMVTPNPNVRKDRLEAKYLPWHSCYWENSSREKQPPFLRESGFETFPVMAPRWDITGEDTYGTDCPGMTALGDVRQLQIMERRKGQAIAKMVDPPLVGPSALRTQKTSLLPGDVTYADVREGMQGLRSIHDVNLNLEHLMRDENNVEYRIQRAFYEDLFLMLARSDDARGAQPVTAREIDERHEEKLLALGPVLERTGDELLDPIVDRSYALMELAGLVPPAPPALRGVQLKVEYISILAQAQKLVGVAAQDRFLQSTGAMIQVYPEMRHKVRPFKVVDSYADMLGIDPELIVPDDEAQAALDAEKKAAAAQQQAEQALSVAKAAQAASQTPLSGDTMLNRIVESGQQQAGQQPVGG